MSAQAIDVIDRLTIMVETILLHDRGEAHHRHTQLMEAIKHMANELQDLQTEVADVRGTIASAVTLIEGIAARIAEAGTDPAALTALTTDLRDSATSLATAVAANQPANAAPPPAPMPAA